MLVEAKPLSHYPWYARLFFRKQKYTYGKVLEPGKLWARSPLLFCCVALLYGALNRKRSPLPRSLRTLVSIRVLQINHCAFCVDINAATLLKQGVSLATVAALREWRSSDLFDRRERLALEFAEIMTFPDRECEAQFAADLKAAFSADEIVELAGLIAFQNMSSKFNAGLDIPPQGFCSPPPAGGDQPVEP